MIVTLQTQRVRTLEQVRVFIEGSEAVDFVGGDREGVYVLVRRTLVQLEYHHRLSKPDKGLVKRYLEKVTGLSRSQLTRLIGQHLRTGKIKDRRGKAPARPFERRYTQSDIRLLAKVDELLNQMSGLGTRAVLRREFAVYGNARFERLAGREIGGAFQRTSVQPAQVAHLSHRAPGMGSHAPESGDDRGAPPTQSTGSTGVCARGYGASGRSGRGQGRISH